MTVFVLKMDTSSKCCVENVFKKTKMFNKSQKIYYMPTTK